MSGMMNEVPLILYSTVGCHLCEEAQALLRAQQVLSADLHWQVIDIANDDALFHRYGWFIPVLRKVDQSAGEHSHDAQAKELHWPFDAQTLSDFLQSNA